MQCTYNPFIQIINFHGLFRNALRCRKTGVCRILVPLRYFRLTQRLSPDVRKPGCSLRSSMRDDIYPGDWLCKALKISGRTLNCILSGLAASGVLSIWVWCDQFFFFLISNRYKTQGKIHSYLLEMGCHDGWLSKTMDLILGQLLIR